MKLEIRIAGRTRTLEIAREGGPHPETSASGGGRFLARLDGRPIEADVVELSPCVYSILLHGQAFEVRVEATDDGLRIHAGGEEFSAEVLDRRAWRGKRGGVLEAEGRQQITAPMPGKVVRVLVKAGDRVEIGQGLLVVEAMKMQNEIRTPKSGRVEKLLASEGQAVNAGELLAIVG